MKPTRFVLAVVTSCLAWGGVLRGDYSVARPDAAALKHRDVLFWTHEERLWGLGQLPAIKPTRSIAPAPTPGQLDFTAIDWTPFSVDSAGEALSLEDFLNSQNTRALVVMKGGRKVLEHTHPDHGLDTHWNTFSIAKSIVGLITMEAVRQGWIPSLDARLDSLLPELIGSHYATVSLRQLMQMHSGIAWNEDYNDPESDVSRLPEFTAQGGLQGLVRHLVAQPRAADAGGRYNYNTGEIYLLGAILERATGKHLSRLASEILWKPAGLANEAHWMLTEEGEIETAGCCIAMGVEDLARLGQYILDHYERFSPLFEASPTHSRYGALWFRQGDQGVFAAGIFGQFLYIEPGEDLVIAMHSCWTEALNYDRLRIRNAFTRAVVNHLGNR